MAVHRGVVFIFFFFNDTATTEIYTLSLHDALPIIPLARMSLPPWITSMRVLIYAGVPLPWIRRARKIGPPQPETRAVAVIEVPSRHRNPRVPRDQPSSVSLFPARPLIGFRNSYRPD